MSSSAITKSIHMLASPEKVWSVLTNDATIKLRATPFAPHTWARSTWQQGAEIEWLVDDTVCVKGVLTTFEPYEEMITTFYDEKDAVFSDTLTDIKESYHLKQDGETTILSIGSGPYDAERFKERGDKMSSMWDEALDIIKNLSEKA